MKAHTVAGIGLGAASVMSTITSAAMGYPTGVIGATYWQSNQMMISK